MKNFADCLPKDRFPQFLYDCLDPGKGDAGYDELAEHLGYSSTYPVMNWVKGARVPLKYLKAISEFLDMDVSELIPLYIAQEMDEADNDFLFDAVCRILTADEYEEYQKLRLQAVKRG